MPPSGPIPLAAITLTLALALASQVAASFQAGPATVLPNFVQQDVRLPGNCEAFCRTLGCREQCMPERMSGSVAVADINGDGVLDIVVPSLKHEPRIYCGSIPSGPGSTTYTQCWDGAGDVSGKRTASVRLLDVDNDGDLDMFFIGFAGGNDLNDSGLRQLTESARHFLFRNDGAMLFTEVAAAYGLSAALIEQPAGMIGLANAGVGDWNRDGYVDIIMHQWLGASSASLVPAIEVMLNRGANGPGFLPVSTFVLSQDERDSMAAVFGVGVGDFDRDGWSDLAVTADFDFSRMLWSDGRGTIELEGRSSGCCTDYNGMGSAFADFNQDGYLDWFVTGIAACSGATCDDSTPGTCDGPDNGQTPGLCRGNRLFLYDSTNAGSARSNRQWVDVTDDAAVRAGYWGWGAVPIDHDGDGLVDVAHTNGCFDPSCALYSDRDQIDSAFDLDPARLFVNDGFNGVDKFNIRTWSEASAAEALTSNKIGRGAVTFDADNDGDLDVLYMNMGSEQPELYFNQRAQAVGPALNWLQVRLDGVLAQEQGYGARVTVSGGGLPGGSPTVAEVGLASHFQGQSQTEIEPWFALTSASAVTVSVEWPTTGVVQEVDVLASSLNAVLTIAEDVRLGFIDGTAGSGSLATAAPMGSSEPVCASATDNACSRNHRIGGAFVIEDINGDDLPDLLLTRPSGTPQLHCSVGLASPGRYTDCSAAHGLSLLAGTAGASAAVVLDLDGDNLLDLVTAGPSGVFHAEQISTVNSAFAAEPATGVGGFPALVGIEAGDIDQDGAVDLVLYEHNADAAAPARVLILEYEGGVWQDRTASYVPAGSLPKQVTSAAIGDFDGNWGIDVMLVGADEQVTVLSNGVAGPGAPLLTAGPLAGTASGTSVGTGLAFFDQLNSGDSTPDFFVTSEQTCITDDCAERCAPPVSPVSALCRTSRMYAMTPRAQAAVDFTAETRSYAMGWAHGAASIDIDNDGDQDMVVANGCSEHVSTCGTLLGNGSGGRLMLNRGADRSMTDVGSRTSATLFPALGATQGRAVVSFDADGDGDLDVLIRSSGAVNPVLLMNNLKNSGLPLAPLASNWLRVRLCDSASAGLTASGFNARVCVQPAGQPQQCHTIGLGSHYQGNSLTNTMPHFGLGSYAGAVTVTVQWFPHKPQFVTTVVVPAANINDEITVVAPGCCSAGSPCQTPCSVTAPSYFNCFCTTAGVPTPLGADADADGICDLDLANDVCAGQSNVDSDADGTCDEDDPTPCDLGTEDADGDGLCNSFDPCPADAHPIDDVDGDGICNVADLCTGDDAVGGGADGDNDGACDYLASDLCFGSSEVDSDGDGLCDGPDDPCDNGDDTDGDGACDDVDTCVNSNAVPGTSDDDGDSVCNADDPCIGSENSGGDRDGDLRCDQPRPLLQEQCPSYLNPASNACFWCDACDKCLDLGSCTVDCPTAAECTSCGTCTDADPNNNQITPCPTPAGCEGCSVDNTADADSDGLCDFDDPCVGPNNGFPTGGPTSPCTPVDRCFGDDTTGDADLDGSCDDMDLCPLDGPDDDDADGLCDSDPADLCYGTSNADADGDNVCDEVDVCLGDDDSQDLDRDGICALDAAGNPLDLCQGDDALGDADLDGTCDFSYTFPVTTCSVSGPADFTTAQQQCQQCQSCSQTGCYDASPPAFCASQTCPLETACGYCDYDRDGLCEADDPCFGFMNFFDGTSGDGGDADGDGVCNGPDNRPDKCFGDDTSGDFDDDLVCNDQDPCINLPGTTGPGVDDDSDGVCNDVDPCTGAENNTGDADGDGICDGNAADICAGFPNVDSDGDGICNAQDTCGGGAGSGDDDGDGVCNSADICAGDDATGDSDGDGVCDDLDGCPNESAPDPDEDSDGICNNDDMCFGDNTTGDQDKDGVCDDEDLCPANNPDDSDGDGVCDNVDDCVGNDAAGDPDNDNLCNDGVSDPCPLDKFNDSDSDGVCDSDDLCLGSDATGDSDGDGECDNYDLCFGDNSTRDTDGDGVCDDQDDCDGDDSSGDTDNDGICDDIDPCPLDEFNDADNDTLCGNEDTCPNDFNDDSDADGVCDGVDICPYDPNDDSDGDGLCAFPIAASACPVNPSRPPGICPPPASSIDNCPQDSDNDIDSDGVCGDVDPCPLDDPDDTDGDTVCDSDEICPGFDDLADRDSDGVPDGCDVCPDDDPNDTDGDGVCDSEDRCPVDNPDDANGDGQCDSDGDIDGDGRIDVIDNCRHRFNFVQTDSDGDGIGDACDSCPLVYQLPVASVGFDPSNGVSRCLQRFLPIADDPAATELSFNANGWALVNVDATALAWTSPVWVPYGQQMLQIGAQWRVGQHGLVQLDASLGTDVINAEDHYGLPDPVESQTPRNTVAVFWTELYPEEAGGVFFRQFAEGVLLSWESVRADTDESSVSAQLFVTAGGSNLMWRFGELSVLVEDTEELFASVGVNGLDGRSGMSFHSTVGGTALQVDPVPLENECWHWNPALVGPVESDVDGDRIADCIDPCPLHFTAATPVAGAPVDADGDAVPDACDNCLFDANTSQEDGDLDGAGDACDLCPEMPRRVPYDLVTALQQPTRRDCTEPFTSIAGSPGAVDLTSILVDNGVSAELVTLPAWGWSSPTWTDGEPLFDLGKLGPDSTVMVDQHGMIFMGHSWQSHPRNGNEFVRKAMDGVIAVLWDEYDLSVGGSVWWLETADEWIVSWEDMPLAADDTETASFQVVLRASDGSDVRFRFGDIPTNVESSATSGLLGHRSSTGAKRNHNLLALVGGLFGSVDTSQLEDLCVWWRTRPVDRSLADVAYLQAGGDYDSDGVGNECDLCEQISPVENQFADNDFDVDGVGDACDECPFSFNPRVLKQWLAEICPEGETVLGTVFEPIAFTAGAIRLESSDYNDRVVAVPLPTWGWRGPREGTLFDLREARGGNAWVDTNGFVSFDSTYGSESLFGQHTNGIAVAWTELNPSAGGDVWFVERDLPPLDPRQPWLPLRREWIVSWEGVAPEGINAQVVLSELTEDVYLRFATLRDGAIAAADHSWPVAVGLVDTTGTIDQGAIDVSGVNGEPANVHLADIENTCLRLRVERLEQPDGDSDGVADACDNCVDVANPTQANADADSQGDLCDVCPWVFGIVGVDDTVDTDGDGLPDLCDPCVLDPCNDRDQDRVCGFGIGPGDAKCLDACDGFNDLNDFDNDSVPDLCDVCPFDPENLCNAPPILETLTLKEVTVCLTDSDFDGVCDDDDLCLFESDNVPCLDAYGGPGTGNTGTGGGVVGPGGVVGGNGDDGGDGPTGNGGITFDHFPFCPTKVSFGAWVRGKGVIMQYGGLGIDGAATAGCGIICRLGVLDNGAVELTMHGVVVARTIPIPVLLDDTVWNWVGFSFPSLAINVNGVVSPPLDPTVPPMPDWVRRSVHVTRQTGQLPQLVLVPDGGMQLDGVMMGCDDPSPALTCRSQQEGRLCLPNTAAAMAAEQLKWGAKRAETCSLLLDLEFEGYSGVGQAGSGCPCSTSNIDDTLGTCSVPQTSPPRT